MMFLVITQPKPVSDSFFSLVINTRNFFMIRLIGHELFFCSIISWKSVFDMGLGGSCRSQNKSNPAWLGCSVICTYNVDILYLDTSYKVLLMQNDEGKVM